MWYDDLIVMGMFALRLAVPLALTIAVGYWLEKRLRLEQPAVLDQAPYQAKPARLAEGAMQIGPAMACWDANSCPLSARADCPAYARPQLPGWPAADPALAVIQPEGASCQLHTPQLEAPGRLPLRVVKDGVPNPRGIAKAG